MTSGLSREDINQILEDVDEFASANAENSVFPDTPIAPTMAATAVDASGKIIHIHNVNVSLRAEDRREDLQTPVVANLPGGEETPVLIIAMNGE